MTVNSLGYQSTKNPIAQSFFIDEASGIFLTKIKLYFKEGTVGLWVFSHMSPG